MNGFFIRGWGFIPYRQLTEIKHVPPAPGTLAYAWYQAHKENNFFRWLNLSVKQHDNADLLGHYNKETRDDFKFLAAIAHHRALMAVPGRRSGARGGQNVPPASNPRTVTRGAVDSLRSATL